MFRTSSHDPLPANTDQPLHLVANVFNYAGLDVNIYSPFITRERGWKKIPIPTWEVYHRYLQKFVEISSNI